jgi:uncharacterized delta-60 repeat protein
MSTPLLRRWRVRRPVPNRPARRARRRDALTFDRLESRTVLSTLSFTTTADGLVADRDLDGTFETAITNDTSVTDRWFSDSTIGQERDVFEFNLSGIAPGTPIVSATLSLTVDSYTASISNGVTTYPQLIFNGYTGTGTVTSADGATPATPAGTGTVNATGVQQFALTPSTLQALEGGNATIRVQNTALDTPWAQFSSLSDTSRQAATLTLVTGSPFTLTVSPHQVNMSAGANAATGTLTRSGDTSQPLTVNLASSDTGKITVPATATFAAGQATTTFGINTVNAVSPYTSEAVTVTASSTVPGSPLGLDPTFGSSGIASTSLETFVQFPVAAIAVQPDGKVLAASEYGGNAWQVERLNADGSVDTSFGTNGVAITTFPTNNGTSPRPSKILVQSDGKVLVGGEFTGGTGTPALARYNADGTLDTTFGTGGIANVGFVEAGQSGWIVDMVERPAPDNRILLAVANNGTAQLRVAQLTPSGSPDSTFAGGGVTSLAYDGLTSAIELLPNGEFLLAGGNEVVRGTANGALDTTFGSGGIATLPGGFPNVSIIGAAVDSSGRIVLGVSLYNSTAGLHNFGVTRLNADGSPDTTFANGGTATASFSGHENHPTSLVVQPDNKVILAGYSSSSSTTRQAALARFNADGTLDDSFGTGGQYTQSLVSSPYQLIYGAALQSDGKLDVLAGWATNLVVARFLLPTVEVVSSSSDTLTVVDDELQPPVAGNDQYGVIVNTPLTVTATQGVLANDSDPNHLPLTAALVAGPAHGQVTFHSDGSFTYTPAAGYSGPDNFTYKDYNGSLTSNTGTVELSVAAGTSSGSIAGTLWNDANGNGQVDGGEAALAGRTAFLDQNRDGVLDNGETWTTTAADGSYAFKGLPAGSYNVAQVLPAGWQSSPATSTDTAVTLAAGTSHDFTFSELASTADQNIGVYDSSGYTFTANLDLADQFTVFGSSNSVRYAGAPALTSYAAPTTLTLRRDDGAPFTLVSMQLSTIWSSIYNVTVSFTGHKADGSLVQQSFPIGSQLGFHLATFSGFTNVTSVTWGVSGVNDYHQFNNVIVQASPSSASAVNLGSFGQPLAHTDSFETKVNTPLTVSAASGVLANDLDPAGQPLTAVVVSPPAHGSVTLNADGSFTYNPATGFVGADSFTYKANDGQLDGNIATVSLAVNPTPAAASFAGSDVITQGAWKGSHGASGYDIAGDNSASNPSLPSYVASVSLTGDSTYTYQSSTSDPRALQQSDATSRIAAVWYAAPSFTINVNMADAAIHRVSLYAMDEDSNRAEQIEVIDPATGQVLDTRSIANFSSGIYLTWDVSGSVTFKVTSTAGVNAVISGLFFDPVAASAAFVKTDSTTQGAWKGSYGASGYDIAGDNSASNPSLPSFVSSVSLSGDSTYVYQSSTSDPRALQQSGVTSRIAAVWYAAPSFTINVNMADAAVHQVALYAMDEDSDRSEQIEVIDTASGTVLDTRSIANFDNGVYLAWNVSGRVTFKVTATAGPNAVISGLFLD